MDFEKSLKELEKIVNRLESSSSTLEEGIELFEKGVALSKQCFLSLGESKKQIEEIKIEMDKLFMDSDD